VLHGGHAAWIIIKSVDKPTDNRPARPFCYPQWLICFSRSNQPIVGPGAFPHTPSMRLGTRLLRRTHRSRAEGGTGRRNKTQSPD